MENQKFILDACCGGRMFWWDKKNPHVLFLDKRRRPKGFMKTRPSFEVEPDILGDFRDLPFEDSSFKMVVFDPPHTIRPKEEGGGHSRTIWSIKKRYLGRGSPAGIQGVLARFRNAWHLDLQMGRERQKTQRHNASFSSGAFLRVPSGRAQ